MMPTTREQLQLWLAEPEGVHLEFKEARHNFHFDKLVDYCVALANEGGGNIILGVTDLRPRRIVDTAVPWSPSAMGRARAIYCRIACMPRWVRRGCVPVRRGSIVRPTKPCWSGISRIIRQRGPKWRSSGKCSPLIRAVKSKFCCASW